MNLGSCCLVTFNKLCLTVSLDMPLKALVILITLLGPTGIYILVSLLVTFLFYLLFVISFFGIPQTHAIAFFLSDCSLQKCYVVWGLQ